MVFCCRLNIYLDLTETNTLQHYYFNVNICREINHTPLDVEMSTDYTKFLQNNILEYHR